MSFWMTDSMCTSIYSGSSEISMGTPNSIAISRCFLKLTSRIVVDLMWSPGCFPSSFHWDFIHATACIWGSTHTTYWRVFCIMMALSMEMLSLGRPLACQSRIVKVSPNSSWRMNSWLQLIYSEFNARCHFVNNRDRYFCVKPLARVTYAADKTTSPYTVAYLWSSIL